MKEPKAIIKLGFSCNNNCIFCHSKIKKIDNPDLTLNQIKKKIILLKKTKIKCILFSGGEVTIRKDIFKILHFAKKEGFSIGLITNIRFLSQDSFVNNLTNYNTKYIYTTLLSSNEDIHNIITQSESFNQTIKGIQQSISNKINTIVNIVIVKDNLNDLKKTVDLLIKLKVKHIRLSFVELITKDDIIFTPNIEEAAKIVVNILNQDYKNVKIRTDGFPLCLLNECKKKISNLRTNDIQLISEPWEDVFFQADEGNKFKPSQICNKCKEYKNCEGIYINYHKYKKVKLLPF